MSSDFVEHIHERLRDELDRLGLKMAEAARAMGEESSQGLRDVCSGRKRASAELIAKLGKIGADTTYILTGDYLSVAQAKAVVGRSNAATSPHMTETDNPVTFEEGLPPDEQLLLEAYRGLAAPARKALLAELLTGGKKPKAKPKAAEDGGIKVSGSGHRVAGRDFNERKE